MKKPNNLALGFSESEKVDSYMEQLSHPLKELVVALRKYIMEADDTIGEGIYWNVPTFYYTGKMEDSDPKEYKRYLVGFNFYKQDAIRLIFLHGAGVKSGNTILEGDFKDGRRMAVFRNIPELMEKENELKSILLELISNLKN